jgi:hypothetical protein
MQSMGSWVFGTIEKLPQEVQLECLATQSLDSVGEQQEQTVYHVFTTLSQNLIQL